MDEGERGRMADPVSIETIHARTALLDALEALGVHRDSVILVGAQAIYLRTGHADVALAEYTTDADLAIDPRTLGPDPRIEEAMSAAGFIRDPANINPGTWISARGIPVDLMVPHKVAGSGRRGATVPPHDRGAMRRTVGLEAALVDNGTLTVDALEAGDERSFDIRVAGAAALLVSKLHKVSERRDTPSRRDNKDAHDIYRILVALPTADLVRSIRLILREDVSRDVATDALTALADLFAAGPEMVGSTMAGQAELGIGDPVQTSLAASILAADLIEALAR